MTPFTLVMAYYENAGMLREHLFKWCKLPADIQRNLSVIIVDDGSPIEPAFKALQPLEWFGLTQTLADVQLWRMGVDVRWNQDACRNIAVREAKTQWLLLTDMDHLVPPETWQFLMTTKLDKHRAHRFQRVNAPKWDPYKPHPNSWAMTRKMYWQIGGYDEALAGRYGTDGDIVVRAQRIAEINELQHVLVRYSREIIPDASTRMLVRKSPEDKEAVTKLIKDRNADGRAPLHFQFPCERVL